MNEIFFCIHNPKRVTDPYGLDNARKYCDMDRSRRLVAPEAVWERLREWVSVQTIIRVMISPIVIYVS